ncbi:DUF4258 domain-containing protein [Paenibacillus naphthalenovorans]|uniref:DUF4258 domain-containing protein n=1 Tax=Paenibacillus naphthalenovorans TaxID=162209 RepID=A0A0U2U7W8_9BACL|nr:DUF4258 domain-containing protein [Paenibacillus naphthalenovorans]ALS22280.1 hypothetical protein IJ22_19060 [Paenibacillus naphthalenovorans]
MTQDELFILIKRLASERKYKLTSHALIRLKQRKLTRNDILDILENPKRLIREDVSSDGVHTYKIAGGINNHRLAIEIQDNELIIIITAMNK